jgi:hypothetical protein
MTKYRAIVETNGVRRAYQPAFATEQDALAYAKRYANMLTHRVMDEQGKTHVPLVEAFEVERVPEGWDHV